MFVQTVLPDDVGETSFYQLTKSSRFHPTFVRENLIDPLFNRITGAHEHFSTDRQHLSWSRIRDKYVGSSLATIVNHSCHHWNANAVTQAEIVHDCQQSTLTFERELYLRPKYFATPFGCAELEPSITYEKALAELGYAGILWVYGGVNSLSSIRRTKLVHLSRIMASSSPRRFAWRLLKNLGYVRPAVAA